MFEITENALESQNKAKMTDTAIDYIKKWNLENTYSTTSLLVQKLTEHLSPEQIVVVLDAIDTTCPHCWDAPIGCQCWNDE